MATATSNANLNRAYEAAARKMARVYKSRGQVSGMDRLCRGVVSEFRFLKGSNDLMKAAERYVIAEHQLTSTKAELEAWLDKYNISYRDPVKTYIKIFSVGVARAVKKHMAKNNLVVYGDGFGRYTVGKLVKNPYGREEIKPLKWN